MNKATKNITARDEMYWYLWTSWATLTLYWELIAIVSLSSFVNNQQLFNYDFSLIWPCNSISLLPGLVTYPLSSQCPLNYFESDLLHCWWQLPKSHWQRKKVALQRKLSFLKKFGENNITEESKERKEDFISLLPRLNSTQMEQLYKEVKQSCLCWHA